MSVTCPWVLGYADLIARHLIGNARGREPRILWAGDDHPPPACLELIQTLFGADPVAVDQAAHQKPHWSRVLDHELAARVAVEMQLAGILAPRGSLWVLAPHERLR